MCVLNNLHNPKERSVKSPKWTTVKTQYPIAIKNVNLNLSEKCCIYCMHVFVG